MIPCQRALFDIPDEIAYINAAYMTPLMRAVQAAGIEGVRRKAAPWNIHLEDFYELPDRARATFARLIGATPDEIAITTSAGYGLQTAAANIEIGAGDTIVVLADQYPANVYVWRELARQRGAELVTVRRAADWNWTPAVLAAIDERTAIAALPNCHWTDGTIVDLVAVGARCRAVGAALVLDVTQSLGAMHFDLAAIRPDFVACATYKWLLGPYSLGFLYVAPEYHDGRGLECTPFSRLHSDEPLEWFSGTLTYRDEYLPGARRFDMGERSNFVALPMAIAAMEQIMAWGVGSIEATLRGMTSEIARRCRDLGLIVPAAERHAAHLIGARFPGAFPAGLNRRLEEEGVHVSCRADSLRISPYLYNNAGDLRRLFAALRAAL